MSIMLTQLVEYLNHYLSVADVKDYCPNGLQVEGKQQINKIVTGVTASESLIDAAIEQSADAILVHHGYFWRGENATITGMKRNRLKKLLDNDISMLAYHLPLDIHPTLGNNAQLALLLGIIVDTTLDPTDRSVIGLQGHLPRAMTVTEFATTAEQVLKRKPSVVDSGKPIQRVAWCTGGGQDYIEQAIAAGVDLFLTGEASERTYYSAVENGISFIAAGHHATECCGIKALGEYIANQYGLTHQFIDTENPF